MEQFIWQNKNWPQFFWNTQSIIYPLATLYKNQGILEGYLRTMSLNAKKKVALNCFTSEIKNTCDFENININEQHLKSIIAQRINYSNPSLENLNINHKELNDLTVITDIFFEVLNTTNKPLTMQQLKTWNERLCELKLYEDRDEKISTQFRQTEYQCIKDGKICYIAPPPKKIESEMNNYLKWFNEDNTFQKMDNVIKSTIAHFYFITIHPFETHNHILAGMIAYRALFHKNYIEDLNKEKYELFVCHLYSIASQIFKDTNDYIYMIQSSVTGSLDMTFLIYWYIRKTNAAVNAVIDKIHVLENKNNLNEKAKNLSLNKRQQLFIKNATAMNNSKISSSEYASMCNCSQDTAYRDLEKMVSQNIVKKSDSKGRSTYYSLVL